MEQLNLLINIDEQKEKNLKASRNYKEEHKEELKIKNKIYRDQNKELIKERYKKWFENNKEKIHNEANKKINCNCGLIVSNSYLKFHLKTKKHLDLLNKIEKKREKEIKLKQIYGE